MSFLDTAKRAFSAKPSDRYDEDYEEYEEYDEYEDESPKKSFFSFLSKRDEIEDEEEEEAVATPARSSYSSSYSRTSSPRERYSSSYSSRTASAAPAAPARSSLAGVEVTVHYPTSLDDATRIIREVKSNRITLIDVSGIATDNEARRVVDYIGGAAFGMDCPFERLCPSIFCMAPVGVKIDAKKSKF